MAIRLTPANSPSRLFCASKFWGDPDLPAEMEYPMIEVEDGGEKFSLPLPFICQIDCSDLEPYDRDGLFPHEGMFYVFGAIDYFLGYDSPVKTQIGEWPKEQIIVKYAKSINYETFQSQIMVDDDDEPIAELPMAIEFSECADDAEGIRFGGRPAAQAAQDNPDFISFLQLTGCKELGLTFPEGAVLNILLRDSDLRFGNWKRGKGYLSL